MSELKRTELRHRMLAEIAEGGMAVVVGLQWNLVRLGEGSIGHQEAIYLSGSEKRVVNDLRPFIAYSRQPHMKPGEAWANDAGQALLASWNDQYGEVQP